MGSGGRRRRRLRRGPRHCRFRAGGREQPGRGRACSDLVVRMSNAFQCLSPPHPRRKWRPCCDCGPSVSFSSSKFHSISRGIRERPGTRAPPPRPPPRCRIFQLMGSALCGRWQTGSREGEEAEEECGIKYLAEGPTQIIVFPLSLPLSTVCARSPSSIALMLTRRSTRVSDLFAQGRRWW